MVPMIRRCDVLAPLLVTLTIMVLGCASGRVGQSGYSIAPVSADVEAGFTVARDAVRDVLRAKPVEIHTRDKRGEFVAFADRGRNVLTPRRLRLVINLKPVSENKTRITIATFPEAYTVQLLTIPAWRPAAFGDNSLAQQILDSVRERVAPATTK